MAGPSIVTDDEGVAAISDLIEREAAHDRERQHSEADNVLLAVLRGAGLSKTADLWESYAPDWWWA